VRKLEKISIPIVFILAILAVFLLNNGYLVNIGYFYLLVIIIFIVFDLIILYRMNHLIKRFALFAVLFFPFALLFELTSLSLHLWEFTSTQYIGLVTIFGNTFPIEELLALIIAPASIGIFYEFFLDNEK
ncbi:MAG: hypothetical protein ACMG57_00485, partial [Candidatus Dojkabacteria bacterium]